MYSLVLSSFLSFESGIVQFYYPNVDVGVQFKNYTRVFISK